MKKSTVLVPSLSIAGLFMVLTLPAAHAFFVGGQSPFTNYAGTGTILENAQGRGGSGWYDNATGSFFSSDPYRAVGSGFMTYTETWATPKTVGTLLLASSGLDRATAGNIYGQFSSGGSFVPLTTFSQGVGRVTFNDLNQTGLYGLSVEVTGGAPDYYQIGTVGFYQERFANAAFGLSYFHSPGATFAGNITDQYVKSDDGSTQFRSAGNGGGDPAEEYTGVDFGAGKLLQGLLVDTAPHNAPWNWTNFDVQVYRGGAWVTLGRANALGGDLYWVNFGPSGEFAEKVRLYGSTVGGNNPDVDIITDIMAFAVIPEPVSFALLALGGLPLLRRRRR